MGSIEESVISRVAVRYNNIISGKNIKYEPKYFRCIRYLLKQDTRKLDINQRNLLTKPKNFNFLPITFSIKI